MAGKKCDGTPDNTPYLRDSKAYCDGRERARAGGLIGDNPHDANGSDGIAWTKGFNSWTEDPAGPNAPPGGQDCCADPYGGGYVP